VHYLSSGRIWQNLAEVADCGGEQQIVVENGRSWQIAVDYGRLWCGVLLILIAEQTN